jgi:hypothetical protein
VLAPHPGEDPDLDLLQCRIALVSQMAAIGHPVFADRALQQAIDLRIGGSNRSGCRD